MDAARGTPGTGSGLDAGIVATDGGNFKVPDGGAAIGVEAGSMGGLDATKADLPGSMDAGRVSSDSGLDTKPPERAWVLKTTVMNDWEAALVQYNSGPSSVNANHYYQAKIDYLEDTISSVTFTTTYVGPASSWLKSGMSQSGQVTWTAPSLQTIHAGEKFSMNLTASHINHDHDNMSGIGSVLAQVFFSDDKGVQTGGASYLKAADGSYFLSSTASNAYAPQSATVSATFGSGTSVGQLMAIRVSAANGNINLQRAYLYEWK